MGRPERLVLLVCTLACLAASATAFRRADGVVNALIGENVIEPTEQPAVERETSPAPAAVVPIADLPYRFKGVSFLEAAQAPTVASVGNGRNGRPCKNGFGCIYETGVCCEGGEVCCEYACRSTNPPTCGPTPQQIALILARKKMELEAKQEIEHEQNLRLASETGKKAAQENKQKNAQEAQMKAKNAVEEEGRKKKDAQREAEEKAAVTAQEEQGKQRENTEKRELEKQKEAAEMSSKSVIIRPDNFSPKKNTILMPHTRIHPADARTYMFWIRPSGLQDGWANIFAKGANNGQRDPSIYFYPKSTRMHIRSGTDGNANDGEDPEAKYALPMFKWSHVAFAHSKAGFVVWLNGQKIVEKKLAGGPLTNSGDLFGSDAFHLPALCTMSDLRYLPRVVTEKELSEAIKAKNYQEITSNTLILREENFRPERSALLARADQIQSAGSETWMFWIKPEGITAQWSNIIHKGAENMQRNPAVWFYPKSTRLHIRSGHRSDGNAGVDPEEALAVEKWTHVAWTHKEGEMVVYYNGQQVSRAEMPGPIANKGDLTASDPWHDAAWCELADLRFVDKVLDLQEIKQIVQQRKFRVTPPREIFVLPKVFQPARNRELTMSLSATSTVPASIKPHVGYSWSWWIKPLGVLDGWTNVFHKGKDDSQRNIAVWMYGNTRRMHIRSQNMLEGVESAPGSGQYPNNNDGLDPNQELALNQWTHVVLIHHHQRMEVFFNGQSVGKEIKLQPRTNDSPIYGSDNSYPPSNVMISDLRFYPGGALSQEKINALFAQRPSA